MAISAKLQALLSAHHIPHAIHRHPVAYTAQEIAAAQHVSGKQLAKCVLLHTDGGWHLAVLPAAQLIDFAKLKALLKAKRVSLAREPEIRKTFPDIEVGAMSCFGNLYEVPTVVDASLAQSQEIVCNAGSHTETLTLRYADFAALAKPKVGRFGLPFPQPRKPGKKSAKKPAAKAKGKSKAKTAPKKRAPAKPSNNAARSKPRQ